MAEQNYYTILGVAPDCSEEQLQAAYHRAASYWHPDRNKSPNAVEMMKLVNIAYEALRDPTRRRQYDQDELARRGYASADPPQPPSQSGSPPRPPRPGDRSDRWKVPHVSKGFIFGMIGAFSVILLLGIALVKDDEQSPSDGGLRPSVLPTATSVPTATVRYIASIPTFAPTPTATTIPASSAAATPTPTIVPTATATYIPLTPTVAPTPKATITPASTATVMPTPTTEPTATATYPPLPTATPPSGVIASFTGVGHQNTLPFIVDASPWRLKWEATGNLYLTLYNPATGARIDTLISNEPSGETLIYGRKGSFYLEISGQDSWTVVIEIP